MSLSRLTLSVLLTLVPLACNYATASPTFTYEANLTTVFSSLSYGDLQAASSDTNLGTFHLSLYQAPSTRLNTSYVSLAVAAAPLCLASHGSGLTDVTLSELASILLGTKNVSFRVVLGSTKVSPASHQLLLSLNDRGVTGFESTEEWPASVLSNTNIVWVQSDAELSTYISRKTAVIGPQASMLASAASVACVRIRLTSSSGDNVAFSQQPTSTTIEHVVLNNAMTRVSTQGGVYPFMGALVLTVPIQTSCADLDNLRGLLTYLFSNANVSSVFAGRNIVSFDNVDQYRMLSNLRDLVSSSCTSTWLAFAAYGDMSVYDVIANTALAYGSTPSYSTYAGGANATVLFQSLAAGDISVAVVDSPSVSQFTPYASTLLIAPVFAQSMAFVYNLDGYDALSASACTMYGLLNGSIAWWDDTMVLNDNVGLTVPHVRVTPLVTNSSSTRSVLAGVNLLYQMCFGSASTPFDVNGGWPFANATDYTYIDAYSTVGTTYGSFAFVPTPTATDRGLTVMPLQLSSGAQLAASASTTASIIQSKAIVDSTTNVAALSLQGSIYPFVSIIHIAVRATYTSSTANCSEISAMLKFFQYLSGGQGNSVASGLGYTIVADAWRMTQQYTTLATHLAKVTCDGTTVLSTGTGSNMMQQQPPQTSSSANLLGPVIGSVFGVLVLVAALVALKILRTRSHSTAPKDEAEPFAIVFTDVQSSTALWANAPLEMGPALEQHHALMRQAIAATGGYEVKTIGDSFMVAYRDAKDAVRFGLMAQRLFRDAEWSNVFDEFYRDEINGKEDVTAAVIAQYDSAAYASLWRGLRVRIGVHYGHGQIKLDPVTQAYDYYGTVVNTAARVEAVGHGGQVCVTAAAAEAAGLPTGGAPVPREDGSIDAVSIKDLGPQELYGLSEAVRLYQVLPQELGARLFPPLRARHGSDNDDDDEQGKDGVSDHSSASGASNVDDDVGSYLDKAAVRLDPKMSGDTLFLFYRFFRAMSKIASATGGEKKSSAQGQNNPIHRLLELWGVTGAPINNLERRLLFATSPSTLHSCRFVVRIATAMRSQRRGKPTVGMSPSRSDDEVHGKHHGVSDHGNSSCTESPTSTLVLADDKKPTFPGAVAGAE